MPGGVHFECLAGLGLTAASDVSFAATRLQMLWRLVLPASQKAEIWFSELFKVEALAFTGITFSPLPAMRLWGR